MWSTVKNIEIYTMNDDAITDKKGKWKLDSHVMARWWQQQWHQLILVMTGKQTLKHLKIQSDRRVRTLFPLPLSALSLGRFNIPSWCCRTKIDFNFLLWRSFAFAVGLFFYILVDCNHIFRSHEAEARFSNEFSISWMERVSAEFSDLLSILLARL